MFPFHPSSSEVLIVFSQKIDKAAISTDSMARADREAFNYFLLNCLSRKSGATMHLKDRIFQCSVRAVRPTQVFLKIPC